KQETNLGRKKWSYHSGSTICTRFGPRLTTGTLCWNSSSTPHCNRDNITKRSGHTMHIANKERLPCLSSQKWHSSNYDPLHPAQAGNLCNICAPRMAKKYRVPYDVLCRPRAKLGCALPPAGRNIN
ncbi:unnamed protein product, partial [Ectocarpus sp. 12 AP-2014]